MKEYHKINSLWKRDNRGDFTLEFAQPEFEYLYTNKWIGTEKIDGTNIRIHWDGEKAFIAGRTDRAQIPPFLYDRLNQLIEKMDFDSVFDGSDNVTLYGEGYGAKIQKGGNYIPDGVDFILFDVTVGDWIMTREAVDDIASKIGVASVPVLFCGPLPEAVKMVMHGFDSSIGTAKAEGLVLVPDVDLRTRRGDRIITKLKTKDFKEDKDAPKKMGT